MRRNSQKGGDKGFLDVGEAELVRDLCNGRAQLIRKLNVFIVRQLSLPVLAILDPLLEVGVREKVLSVEAAWSLGYPGVEALQVIRTAYHQDAVIVLESIDLVEEVTTDLIRDNTVQILEDQITGGRRSCLGEDQAECILGPCEADWDYENLGLDDRGQR